MSLATLARGHFGPRGIIYTIMLEVHKVMLHTKYQSSRPYGFRQEDFLCFSLYKPKKSMWSLARGHFGPRGIIYTIMLEVHKVMLHTKYQSSRPYGFRQGDFLCFSLYKPKKSMWSLGRGHFWTQGSNLNKLGRGSLDDTTYRNSKL